MDDIKEKIRRYYEVQQASTEAAALRKQLVPLLKQAELTKTKFDFGDKTVGYDSYYDYESITQKQIRQVLSQYPQIDADLFVKQVYDARKKKLVETVKVCKKRSK